MNWKKKKRAKPRRQDKERKDGAQTHRSKEKELDYFVHLKVLEGSRKGNAKGP